MPQKIEIDISLLEKLVEEFETFANAHYSDNNMDWLPEDVELLVKVKHVLADAREN